MTAINQQIMADSSFTVPVGKSAEFYIQPLPRQGSERLDILQINSVPALMIERGSVERSGPFFANAGDVVSYVGVNSVAISCKLTDAA